MNTTDVHRLLDTGPGGRCVIDALIRAGGRPMLAGGFVRDALLRTPVQSKDLDIEVYGISSPDDLATALSRAGQVTEVGRSFGVFKVSCRGQDIDVSLPRTESKFGVGHRGFMVLPDSGLGFAEATARRDFTINAMLFDPAERTVIDPHRGQADLRHGVLRHTSAAFTEDPLRVLRAMQFSARFGFILASETAGLCEELAPQYGDLSIERVWGEWEKLATRGVHIDLALESLADTGWEQHFPQIAALHGIAQDPAWHPEGDAWEHTGLAAFEAARLADDKRLKGADRAVIVLAALCHDFGKVTHTQVQKSGKITSHGHALAGVEPAKAFLRSVGAPQHIISRVLPLVREHMSMHVGSPTPAAVRRLARRLGPTTIEELTLVSRADVQGRGVPGRSTLASDWLTMARGLSVQDRPAPGILTGHHLIEAGLEPGPVFKHILASALEAQDAGTFSSEAGARTWLEARLPGLLSCGKEATS